MKFQHGGWEGSIEGEEEKEEEAEGIFECEMPRNQRARGTCPVPGCETSIVSRAGMRRHFVHRHPEADVHFPDEGPLEKCRTCGMKVPNVERHRGSQLCQKARERAERRRQEEANRETENVRFTVGGKEIETVKQFKYLGRVLSEDDDDWPAIQANIQKARKRWGQVAKILAKEGATSGTMAYFYKAVVQAVLLYGSESWVITTKMWRALNSFHHRCARYIAGEHIRQRPDGEWTFPETERILAQCKLQTVEEYIARRKRTVSNYIVGRPIYARCVESIPSAANVNQKVWWDS